MLTLFVAIQQTALQQTVPLGVDIVMVQQLHCSVRVLDENGRTLIERSTPGNRGDTDTSDPRQVSCCNTKNAKGCLNSGQKLRLKPRSVTFGEAFYMRSRGESPARRQVRERRLG